MPGDVREGRRGGLFGFLGLFRLLGLLGLVRFGRLRRGLGLDRRQGDGQLARHDERGEQPRLVPGEGAGQRAGGLLQGGGGQAGDILAVQRDIQHILGVRAIRLFGELFLSRLGQGQLHMVCIVLVEAGLCGLDVRAGQPDVVRRIRNAQRVRLGEERRDARGLRAFGQRDRDSGAVVRKGDRGVGQVELLQAAAQHGLQLLGQRVGHGRRAFGQGDRKGQHGFAGRLRRNGGLPGGVCRAAACGERRGHQHHSGQQAAQNTFFQGEDPSLLNIIIL